jgi:hypothetical protein
MTTVLNEEVAAQSWLKDKLKADVTLMDMVTGVRYRSVETDLRTPFIKIDRLDSSDLMVVGMYRVWANLTYLVRAVVQWEGGGDLGWDEAWDRVQVIADRIDVVLHRTSGTSSTVNVGEVYREETFTDETQESGDTYLHAGGIYRCHVMAL